MSDGKVVKLRLRYVVEDVDRHGNVRVYFRRRGRRKVRLHGMVGSKEFMDAYQAELEGNMSASSPPPSCQTQAKAGSFHWVCQQYYRSADFKQLEFRTQSIRHVTLDKICLVHGDKPVDRLEAKHVRQLRDEAADRPEAANTIIKTLRQLLKYGAEMGHVRFNCARDVSYIRTGSQGFHTWSETEIELFKVKHPIGSQAGLALGLLLNLGQRRSDVIRLGWQHVSNGKIAISQKKNSRKKLVTVVVPIVPELAEALAAVPKTQMQFLITKFGRPFTANGFGNKMKRWCLQAGLSECTSHGLRKACAVRLAEAGCTDHEIMSITGHRTLKEVARYTSAANQVRLAERAMGKLERIKDENKNQNTSVPLSEMVEQSGTLLASKPLKSQR